MAYFGSKTAMGVHQAVISQMPPHDVYVEAFAGSGAIFQRKPRAPSSLLIERDPKAAKALLDETRVWDGGSVFVDHGDALKIIPGLDFRRMGRVLVYADPPYVIAARTSAKRYRFDFTDADHRQLIAILRGLPANVAVILSGYPSALYDELLGDWRTVQFQAMTRGGPRTEQLWMNFPDGPKAWSAFAGKDFTDRQRIKRKAARWVRNYERLPEGERLAILAALMKAHGPAA